MAERLGGEPLRIGVLGAARIAEEALIAPARALGHHVVAVAARDRARAAAFAARHGIERVHDSYADLLADPDVDLVYDPLANGLHGPWNLAAIGAGKHVLGEKPFASTAEEAAEVLAAAREAGLVAVEGFHYLHHPLFRRVQQLLDDGELGELRAVDAEMVMPAPDEGDPRWSFALAGGALMDLGCYCLHAARVLGRTAGGEPQLLQAAGEERPGHPGVDEWLTAELEYPSGATARAHCDMAGEEWRFRLRVVGSAGEVVVANFVKPAWDDRLTVITPAGERVEHLGTRPSYDHQLAALAGHLREGAPWPLAEDDPLVQARLVDQVYSAAGFPLRHRTPATAAVAP
jgi:predicted dehydrogenase